MQSENTPNDQARLLRQLAQPAVLAERSHLSNDDLQVDASGEHRLGNQAVRTKPAISHTPHVVLISELPSLQGGLGLAFSLAEKINQKCPGTLLVDLAPSASHLRRRIEHRLKLTGPSAANAPIQPLWEPSPHGRTLAEWPNPRNGKLSIVAQPEGEFPTADQMPRLCEQLIRRIERTRPPETAQEDRPHQQVLLVSECVGLPLDSVCWQTADTILLLHDSETAASQIESILSPRLPVINSEQRLVLLRKKAPSLKHWALKHWTSRGRIEQRGSIPCGRHPNVECWNVLWPLQDSQADGHAKRTRYLQAAAQEIHDVLLQPASADSGRVRQAG